MQQSLPAPPSAAALDAGAAAFIVLSPSAFERSHPVARASTAVATIADAEERAPLAMDQP
jgi:hypothetical protein